MPKLSAFIEVAGAAPVAPEASKHLAVADTHPPLPRQPESLQQRPLTQQLQQEQQAARSTSESTVLDAHHTAALHKLQAEYAKRVREHGARTYRWPDGSLRPDRPPPNPHAVASRQQWSGVVQHCRMHGGDRGYERQGYSLQHGLGVDHSQHAAYLRSIGLEPETTGDGEFLGAVTGLPDPLQDPEHCFNTYYKEQAEAVFRDKLGRLL